MTVTLNPGVTFKTVLLKPGGPGTQTHRTNILLEGLEGQQM